MEAEKKKQLFGSIDDEFRRPVSFPRKYVTTILSTERSLLKYGNCLPTN